MGIYACSGMGDTGGRLKGMIGDVGPGVRSVRAKEGTGS
jgi:hypothetical protein